MNKKEFLDYMWKVEQLYRKFQKKWLNKAYIMKFSNGELINFSFYEQSFAHLVGIQINKLKESGLVPKNLQANDILEFIFFNPERFYRLIIQNGYKATYFISSYYKEKISVMKNIYGFLPASLEFIVKFDSNKAFLVNDELKPNVEYLLGYKIGDGYGMIGIKKSSYGNYYPLTVLYYDKDSLKELLKYQTLLLPTYTKVKNIENEIISEYGLYEQEKIKKLKIYNSVFERQYGCVTNLTSDYIRTLEHTTNHLSEEKEQNRRFKEENYELQVSNINLSKENDTLKQEVKKLKAILKITGANENIDKYLKLKMDIFDGEDIDNSIIDRAFLALTNKEKNLLEYYYGLNGKDKLSWKEIANIYEISSIQYIINKLKNDFKNICLGLKAKNPYIELLTDKQKLLSLAFSLPKEERDAYILKNGLLTCNRASNKEISEKLGIPYIKVKKIVDSAEEKVREMAKR